MLDWGHGLVLRAVAGGDVEESRALRNLIATGLVAERPDGTFAVTDAGRAAIAAGMPSRLERLGIWVLALCLVVLAAGFVIGWIAG